MNGCWVSSRFRAFQWTWTSMACFFTATLRVNSSLATVNEGWDSWKILYFLIYLLVFYIDLFPSTHGTGIICVSSCIYRWSLSQRGYKLSSSWEVFIYKQKSCFKQSVRGNVTGLSLSIISEKGWKKDNWVVLHKWRKHKDKSVCLQVCLIGEGCWHPCAISGRSWHLDRARRDGGWRDNVS